MVEKFPIKLQLIVESYFIWLRRQLSWYQQTKIIYHLCLRVNKYFSIFFLQFQQQLGLANTNRKNLYCPYCPHYPPLHEVLQEQTYSEQQI